MTIVQNNLFSLAAMLLAVLVTWLFGEATAGYLPPEHRRDTGYRMLLIAGTGWIAQALAALLLMKKGFIQYARILAFIMLIGVFLLLPSITFSRVAGYSFPLL